MNIMYTREGWFAVSKYGRMTPSLDSAMTCHSDDTKAIDAPKVGDRVLEELSFRGHEQALHSIGLAGVFDDRPFLGRVIVGPIADRNCFVDRWGMFQREGHEATEPPEYMGTPAHR